MAYRRQAVVRRRKKPKVGMNLSYIVVIIGLAVIAGYLTTRYFIYPVILGKAPDDLWLPEIFEEEGQNDEITEGITDRDDDRTEAQKDGADGIIEDGLNIAQSDNIQTDTAEDGYTPPETFSGYCVQYGSFATREAADAFAAELGAAGIISNIIQKDSAYKVIGELFKTKEEAEAVKTAVSPSYSDVFIAHF